MSRQEGRERGLKFEFWVSENMCKMWRIYTAIFIEFIFEKVYIPLKMHFAENKYF